MIEQLLFQGSKGNQQLPAYGTMTAGYYGKRTEADVISAAALATHIGLTAGIAETSVAPSWLEFALNGKRVFMATRAFRHTLSWDAIYNVGAAQDVLGNQGVPTTVTVRPQNAQVSIKGITYQVRCITIAEWVQVVYPLMQTWVPAVGYDMNFTTTNGAARWTLNSTGNPNARNWVGWNTYLSNPSNANPSNSSAYSGGWSPLLVPI